MRAHSVRLWLVALLTVGIASWWQLPTRAQAPAPQPGVVYGAGDSLVGELGVLSVNLSPPRLFPSPASPFEDVIDAALGADHSLVLRSDGSVWGTGINQLGQLGLPNPTDGGAQPTRINGLPPIVKVAAGANHSLALDNTGAVWAFGSDANGQLGIGVGNNTASFVPMMIPTLSSVVDIAAGADFSLAVDSAGAIWAWGSNTFLQLGNPGPSQTTPILVPKGVGFFATRVAAGGRTAMALSNSGQVMPWGNNSNQQISTSGAALPSGGAPLVSNIRSMAVGDSHVLLLKTDGTVFARGLGTSGQLGLGNSSSSSVFVTIPGLSNVIDVAAGAAHSAAVHKDGSIWTWGSNSRSQLGTSTPASQASTAKLTGFPATGRSVVAAANSTLFLNQPGALAVTISTPINATCTQPFSTVVNVTGYDVVNVTPNDIVLVLDESGSIGASNFELLRQFALNFVNAQNISPTTNRVGVVMFSNSARVIINLSNSKPSLINAINNIQYFSGSATCIGCGISRADQMLDALARPNANRMMVVVTDGMTTPNVDPNFENIVAQAQQSSTLFAIGVGAQVSADQINFIASDVPNTKTAFLTTDFGSLTTIIANLSLDLVPAFTNVTVTFDLGTAIVQNGAASVNSGNVSSSAGLVTWTLPSLGSTTVTLGLPQRGAGLGGTLPLFDDIQYNVGDGAVHVPVPTINIVGCPASMILSPPSATHTIGQNHTASFSALDTSGAPVSTPMRLVIVSGPNAGRQFAGNSSPSQVSYSSSLPGIDTLQAFVIGQPIPPATATVEWRVPNHAPTANAGLDQVVQLNGATTATFTLNGSGTDDGNVQPLSFQWFEGGSPVGSAASLTLTRGLGAYDFTLTDFDGELSGSDSVRVTVVDPTPPLASPIISGPAGNNGWYTGPVAITWKAVDHESTIISPACLDALLKDDGANQIVTCFAESAGGKTSATASVNIDSTPPVVTAAASVVATAIAALTPVTYSGESATDATSGVASFGCSPASGSDFPLGATLVTCSATDGAGNSASGTFTVTVAPATTSLTSLQLAQTGIVGDAWSASTTLSRTTAPAGPLAGMTVAFTLTAAGGDTTVLTGTTDAAGFATVTFTPSARGVHTVSAQFAATGGVQGSSSNTATVEVYQRTKLTLSPASGPAGSSISLIATLVAVPSGAALAGQAVDISFGGAALAQTLLTDANGVATFTVTIPNAGLFSALASFNNGAAFFTNNAGAVPPLAETATAAVTVSDSTPPIITSTVVGTSINGWYTGDVIVSWTVTDPDGAVTQTGCDTTTVSTDGAGITLTCIADSAGGTSSKTVTLSRDTTAPSLTTSPNLSVVATSATGATVNYAAATATDATSLIASVSCTPPAGFFPLGTTTVLCTATDNAGNASTRSFTVTVSDPTPPVIVATVAGTLGANNWYTSDVTVNWSVTDPDGPITSSTGCTTSTTNADGASFTKTCTATSAGGTSTKSVTFKRDASAPGITVSPNKSVEADAWDGADVTYAAATATDPTSGIASVACAPPSGSTFPIGVTTVTCVATNNAGLTKTGTFTVTVSDNGEPGKMRGDGDAPAANNHKIEFNFAVIETRRGFEWGDVNIKVRDTRRRRGDDERFDARTVDDVFFSNAPEYGPGRNSNTGIDTVTFRGTGKWDGHANYRYVVTASDRGEPGRGRDTFTIQIIAPNGTVVFNGGGTLTDGNVQSSRLQRPWSWWNGHHGNSWRR